MMIYKIIVTAKNDRAARQYSYGSLPKHRQEPVLMRLTATSLLVIPVKTGIHLPLIDTQWIPAFAGMTTL
jgi:hypothetical protein